MKPNFTSNLFVIRWLNLLSVLNKIPPHAVFVNRELSRQNLVGGCRECRHEGWRSRLDVNNLDQKFYKKMNKGDNRMVDMFNNKCLQKILRIK